MSSEGKTADYQCSLNALLQSVIEGSDIDKATKDVIKTTLWATPSIGYNDAESNLAYWFDYYASEARTAAVLGGPAIQSNTTPPKTHADLVAIFNFVKENAKVPRRDLKEKFDAKFP